MKRNLLLLTIVIAALSIGLAGCGSSDSTTTMTDSASTEAAATTAATTEAATTDTAMVTTGSAVCDDATLTKAAMAADKEIVKVEPGVKCADGWAVIYPTNADYTFTMVFEAEGEFWVYKKGVDCATIPMALQDACNTN
ncbi:MAG: hypothetical protein WCO40_03400 [Thermoleophilia bacterium]